MRSVMRTEYVIEGSRVNTVTCRVAPPPLAPGCLLFPDAFEAGSLSDGTCGQRVEQQGAKLAELRVRQDELRRALDAAQLQPPTRQGWPTLPSSTNGLSAAPGSCVSVSYTATAGLSSKGVYAARRTPGLVRLDHACPGRDGRALPDVVATVNEVVAR